MKTQFTAILLLAAISFATMTKADDAVVIPVISKPAILDEGTQRDLTAAQIAELLPWAKDSKIFLNDLLESIQGLPNADKLDRLVEGIEQVVGESAPKNSELLMRYALNRGLAINGILEKEMDADAVGTIDAKIRVLRSSINMAIKYYDTDMATLSKKTPAPFITFGIDYFNFLNELNKSIFDASAQYAIERTSLEWLQWDLYRDLNNTQFAPQIVKINNSLKIYPTKKLTDAQSIAYIRQMKNLAQQLKVLQIDDKPIIIQKSSQEFESYIAQKIIARTIDEAIAASDKAISQAQSVNDFFRAVEAGIANPNQEYLNRLATLAYDKRMVLINNLPSTATDIQRLITKVNNVDQIIEVTRISIPKMRSASEFLILFRFCVDSPSAYYKQALGQLASTYMQTFFSLNPTQAQRDEFVNRFR
jgi:hypothetical protein